jgi:hypothetical protein
MVPQNKKKNDSAQNRELNLTELPLFVTMYMIKYYNESGTRLSFGPVCRSFPGSRLS